MQRGEKNKDVKKRAIAGDKALSPGKHRPRAASVGYGLHSLREEVPWTMKVMDATFTVLNPHLIWTTTFILEAHSLLLSHTIICIEPGKFTFF